MTFTGVVSGEAGSSTVMNIGDGSAYRVDAQGNKETAAPHTPPISLQLKMPQDGP